MSWPPPLKTAGPGTGPVAGGWLLSGTAAQVSGYLLLLNLAGMLAGYYILHNQWLQVGWFLFWTAAWMALAGPFEILRGLRVDAWLRAVALACAFLLVRSTWLPSPGSVLVDVWMGWLNTALLLGLLLLLWQAAWLPRFTDLVGQAILVAACAAAVVSMLVIYGPRPQMLFVERLRNTLVYGGWNPVCTGLTFGFAAVWGTARWAKAETKRERRFWLYLSVPVLVAALLTLSRGTLLALLTAFAVPGLVCGWRMMRRPLLLFVTVAGICLGVAPALHEWVFAKNPINPGSMTQASGGFTADSNPVQEMVKRADSNRFVIYQAALASMTTWQDWLVGKGAWSINDSWSCSLHWYPEHLHSIFMDALVRGGVVTLTALLVLLAWGLWQALTLAHLGEPLWLMLACFGCAGLLFDGDSAFRLISVPRFEALILWTPLAIASARLWRFRQGTDTLEGVRF